VILVDANLLIYAKAASLPLTLRGSDVRTAKSAKDAKTAGGATSTIQGRLSGLIVCRMLIEDLAVGPWRSLRSWRFLSPGAWRVFSNFLQKPARVFCTSVKNTREFF